MTFAQKLAVAGGALAIFAAGATVGYSQAYQPHMQVALDALKSARHNLEVASTNKGGHRVTALGLVDQAIGEVKAGIAAGDL
jgi:hypothetical protein